MATEKDAHKQAPVVSSAGSFSSKSSQAPEAVPIIAPDEPMAAAYAHGKEAREEGSIQPDTNDSLDDPDVVFWDEPVDQDPANPMNWTAKKKWTNILIVSSITFVVPLGSSMFAPGVPNVMAEFHSRNPELATFVVSIYLIGFALGPLIFAPLSEIYGRAPLYHITNVLFIVFSIGCAKSTSMGMLIAFRLLAGCVGGTPLTIGAGTLTDLMPAETRAGAMAVFAIGPLLGPVIGPVAGGFLVNAKGWRWVFWLLAIVSGFLTVVSFFVLKETYAPVILERKVAKLRKSTGNLALRSKLSENITKKDLIVRGIVRPMKLLFGSPLIFLLAFYIAVTYGILYVMFTTFTFVFKDQYRFSTSIVGLSFLGIGIGMMAGTVISGVMSNRSFQKLKASGVELKPEHRMAFWHTMPGAFLIPIGLFIYGWTAEYKVHWIVPIIGTAIMGYGLIGCMFAIQNYIIDSFTLYSASAMAATAVFRSILGALLPLAGLRMIQALGLGWSNSILAFLALALIPVPACFKIWGERIRLNPRFQVKL